ncbi:MAG TPA: helix-hairpin-helix domain-containing protein, partial [Sunxiuqinia sp.]|nr:helix-hairpin-helix domain-containing protein [Sunxiuqinia sp.]
MKRILVYIMLLGLCSLALAQPSEVDFQSQLENLLEASLSEDATVDVEQLLNELEVIHEHPLNINQANRADFQGLYFLSTMQINNLLNYRRQYGQIFSPYELNAIDGFDPQLIKLFQAFVVFGRVEEKSRKQFIRQSVLLRGIRLVEKQKGYREPAKYEGSPEKLYFRYRLS